jgi:hypothetical protein
VHTGKVQSVLQDWVMRLGLRHQGVLLAAIRGCDGVAKHDLSKPIMRAIRWAVMVPFDARELTEPKGFIYYEPESFREGARVFAKNTDEYPLHFVFHAMHALEMIGYCHPDPFVRENFKWAYVMMVRNIHLAPETAEQMNARLTEDRIASNSVAG